MDFRDVWRSLFPRRMTGPDVRAEIEFHIEGRVRELKALGWSEDDARVEVMSRFGDVVGVEEACRAYDAQRVNGAAWRGNMEAWIRDVRMALRSMRKSPGFTTIVVITLALGVGAATSVFSVVEGILLRPLPFVNPEALAVIWENDRATGTVRENASTADYYDFVERNRTFVGLAQYGLSTSVLTRPGSIPMHLNAASVSRSLATILGVQMQLGRNFVQEEDVPGGPAVVILTNRVWRDILGGDPAIVGRVVTIDDLPAEVVGVLPSGIDYPASETDVWLPIQQSQAIATRSNHWIRVVGRLAPGTSIEAAHADMVRIMADLEVEYSNDNTNRGAYVESMADVGRADLRTTLWVLFGAVLAVLAIACVNVTNLLLARGAGRSRELAVLTALGAGPGHIRRKFLTEGILIAVFSAIGGVLIAAVGVKLLTSLAPSNLLSLGQPSVNMTVLAFALGISVVIGLGFGVMPSLQGRRLDVQRALKDGRTTDGGRASFILRRVLVAAQLSMAIMLLLGATLLFGTIRNLQAVDPGFRAEGALRVDFSLSEARYPRNFSTYPNWPEVQLAVRRFENGVAALPGVTATAVVLNHPLEVGFTNSFRIDGRAHDPTQGEMTTRLITPGYFETAGLEMIEGRRLLATDGVNDPAVIVINKTAAARYFPEGDAIGQRIAFWGPSYREVVGIVADELIHGLTVNPPPAMYATMYQSPPLGGKITLMVRTVVPPLTLVDGVRRVMREIDPAVPIFNVATMEATLAQAMERERFASAVLSIFASVAVFLALLGVHGVLAYLVAQRGQEVGVRMALGATRGDVVALVMREGVSMIVVGLVVGLGGALALSGVLAGLLFGISSTSPAVYALVAVSVGLVAFAASAIPAHRAATLDPVSALRSD